MKNYVVLVTTKNINESKKITNKLLNDKLAACVNIIPKILSYYWWEGKVVNDEEALLVIKTAEPALDKLIQTLKAIHSYDVPEIIALEIEKGNDDYLKWIEKSIMK
ncbi:MAG: divalent-cation tolerance protein CutA [Elusimicrobiota bacterium]